MSPEVLPPGDRPLVAVVGGGVAGLAAAWRLVQGERPPRVVVLEQGPAVGGKLALGEVGGLTVDLGAESVLARRPEAIELARAVGLADDLVSPRPAGARIWSRGALRPLPVGTLMGVPSSVEGLVGLLLPDDVTAVAAEPGHTWGPLRDSDIDVGSFVALRVGQAVVDRLVEPLLGGVYAGRSDRLSLRATVPALWRAAVEGRSLVEAAAAAARAGQATQAPVFAGVRGGVGRLPQALAAAVRQRGAEVRTGCTVRRLERTPGGWRLVTGPTSDEQLLDVDAVVLATPAAPTSRLLREHAPGAAQSLSQIEYASVALVTLVLPRASVATLTGSGFLVPPVEGRLVKAATFSSAKWGWTDESHADLVVVRTSVGRHGDEAELQRDDDDLARRATDDLADLLGVPLPAVASRVDRWGGGLPQYAVGHVDRVTAVREAVGRLPGLALAGAAYDGVGVPACVASGDAAARAVTTHLERQAVGGGG